MIDLFGDGAVWIRIPVAGSTYDEAVLTRDLLHPRGIQRIAVVTSPMHTRRACATFEAVGFQVECVPSRFRACNIQTLNQPFDRVQAFGQWIYEQLGMIKYRRRG